MVYQALSLCQRVTKFTIVPWLASLGYGDSSHLQKAPQLNAYLQVTSLRLFPEGKLPIDRLGQRVCSAAHTHPFSMEISAFSVLFFRHNHIPKNVCRLNQTKLQAFTMRERHQIISHFDKVRDAARVRQYTERWFRFSTSPPDKIRYMEHIFKTRIRCAISVN